MFKVYINEDESWREIELDEEVSINDQFSQA